MKIAELGLNHFRSARHVLLTPALNPLRVSLALHENLNVFVGINGSGKTTILDAISIMLSWAIARIQFSESSGDEISEKDITNDKGYTHLDIECIVEGIDREVKLFWRLVQTRRGHNPKEEPQDAPIENEFRDLDIWAANIRNNIGNSGEQYNLPVFAFYPVNRVVRDIPLKIRQSHRFDLLETYDEALSGGANFRMFFEWYRNREDLENEQRSELGIFQPDSQLEAVRRAILSFLPGFIKISVKRNPLRMEVAMNGKTLSVDQLSDGEKCLFALIGDLARRLAIANPVSQNPLQGNGIVLIDEIDLHLHPAWQRMVIPKLRDTFPNCQFFLTTHSPEIITHVQPESLFLLSQDQFGLQVGKASESYGKTSDRILEDLMGLTTTRPIEIADELMAVFSAIDRNQTDDARMKIQELRQKIGDDSELVKAEVLIRRKELIGK